MNNSTKRFMVLAVVSLAALLTVGATTASAHGGPGLGPKGASSSALVTEAAKQLNVTRAKLKDAIVNAAVARIDQAVKDGDVADADAGDLKDQASDDLRFAISLSQTATVASNLGITTTQLNDGFRAARKALILKQIDAAVAAGRLSAADAAEMKQDLDNADLPGYKAFGFGGYGFGGHGFGGHGHFGK